MGRLSIGKGINDETERGETLVNVFSFGKCVSGSTCFANSFRTRQINEVNLTTFGTEVSCVLLVNLKNKATM